MKALYRGHLSMRSKTSSVEEHHGMLRATELLPVFFHYQPSLPRQNTLLPGLYKAAILLLIVSMGVTNARHSFLKARILSRDYFRFCELSPLCSRLLLWKQVFALWEAWRANCDHVTVLWMIDRSYRNRQSQLDEDAKWSPVHFSPLARRQAPAFGETRFCGT